MFSYFVFFLCFQVRHRYEIVFNFEWTESMENMFDLQTCGVCDHVQIIELKTNKPDFSLQNSKTFHTVTAHLYAYKEKLLKEKILLQSKSQKSQSLTFIFCGRVLGIGKGTPFLKQGIKCIGFESDDDTENSDIE